MGIPDDTNEQKISEFLNLVTRNLLNLDCLKACHHLLSAGKNKIIINFSKREDVNLVIRNKHKLKHAKLSNINIPSQGKVYIN